MDEPDLRRSPNPHSERRQHGIPSDKAGTGSAYSETSARWREIPDVADARQAARDSLAKAEAGDNPVAEKKAVTAAAITVAAAVARYLAECDRDLKRKTAREWRRIFEHDVLPRLGRSADCRDRQGRRARTRQRQGRPPRAQAEGSADGAAVQAGKMLTRLRTLFGWTVANDLTMTDPTAGVRRPAKEASRDRVLSDGEIVAFWTAAIGLARHSGRCSSCYC